MNKNLRFLPKIFLKGMAMGMADLIPGVSGGTIALVAGIYERLINAISRVDRTAFSYLLQKKWKTFWTYIDGNFLFSLIVGILTSIFLFSKLIRWLLHAYPIYVWSFFFGLVWASGVYLFLQIKRKNGWVWAFWLAGIVLAWYVTSLVPLEGNPGPLFVFFSGFLASIAMILPGISGSFILVLLGMYAFILQAVHELKIGVLLLVAAGVVTGLLSFSRLLKKLFRDYPDLTMGLLSGFLFGSLNKLWPWKEIVKKDMIEGKEIILQTKNVWPGDYSSDPHWIGALIAALAGVLVLWLLERTEKHNSATR